MESDAPVSVKLLIIEEMLNLYIEEAFVNKEGALSDPKVMRERKGR
jgi:hypothetical protein